MPENRDSNDDVLNVTRSYLPPLEEVLPYLEEIWRSRRLSNAGPLHERLEEALRSFLGVGQVSLFNNGTQALVTALQTLELTGEVITTPFSFIATANALLWRNLRPVFVDVDPATLNLDPGQVEEAITPRTTALLPVHVYGQPADVHGLRDVAARHGLKIVYDAAHCFGVEDDEGSVLRHGDLSVLSFHATKVFNTFEGGAIVSHDAATKARIDQLRNFGLAGETRLVGPGLNGKMNEFQAAVGLAQLGHMDEILEARARVDTLYREALGEVSGLTCYRRPNTKRHNHAYFPIFVDSRYPLSRDALLARLAEAGINARRYFYPLLTDLLAEWAPGCGDGQWPTARAAADGVICLPMSPDMVEADVHRVAAICAAPGAAP